MRHRQQLQRLAPWPGRAAPGGSRIRGRCGSRAPAPSRAGCARPSRASRVSSRKRPCAAVAVDLCCSCVLLRTTQQLDQPAGAPVRQPQRAVQRRRVGTGRGPAPRRRATGPASAADRPAAHARVRRGGPRLRAGAAPRWRCPQVAQVACGRHGPPPARSCRRAAPAAAARRAHPLSARHEDSQPGGEPLLGGLGLRQHAPGFSVISGVEVFGDLGHGSVGHRAVRRCREGKEHRP
jgi:hypothetical protein